MASHLFMTGINVWDRVILLIIRNDNRFKLDIDIASRILYIVCVLLFCRIEILS